MQMKTSTQKITFCALFAALTAILSQIAIPIGPVPINLATLAVFIAGGLMGPVWGAVSMIVYVALGAVGVPVFAMFTGGISIIAMVAGLAVCYALGTAWYMYSTAAGLGVSLMSCVIPFLPGDAAKIALAVITVSALRKRLAW